MLKVIEPIGEDGTDDRWLQEFWQDFRRRFVSLLGFQFCKLSPALALAVLHNKAAKDIPRGNNHQALSLSIVVILYLLSSQTFPKVNWSCTSTSMI